MNHFNPSILPDEKIAEYFSSSKQHNKMKKKGRRDKTSVKTQSYDKENSSNTLLTLITRDRISVCSILETYCYQNITISICVQRSDCCIIMMFWHCPLIINLLPTLSSCLQFCGRGLSTLVVYTFPYNMWDSVKDI
jgi:hypothetical protein